MKIKGKTVLFALWYFFVLCPFISPVRMPMDIQPCALLVSILVILIERKIVLKKEIKYLWCLTFVATIMMLWAAIDNQTTLFLIFRKYMNYISLCVITTAGYMVLLSQGEVKENWIKKIILLWLVVGILESLFPSLSQVIMRGSRTTRGRGVVGLAMEPSFYGYMAFFFMLLATQFKEKKHIYMGISIIQVLFFAKSAVSAIYVLIYFGCCCIEIILSWWKYEREKIKKLMMGLGVGIILLYIGIRVFIKNYANTRMVSLFVKLFKNIASINNMESLYKIDYSVAERFDSIVSSFKIFITNFGLPLGFDYTQIGLSGTKRIMSGFGSVMCEMGWIGVILIVLLILVLVEGYGKKIAISILFAMFSAVQLSSPTFALLIAIAMFYVTKRDDLKYKEMDKT